jgi:CheY-like chemotaxis protein
VAEVLDTVRPLAEARGIRLENRTSAQEDCHILADRQRTRQVLLNLLSNAIKYNFERGEVQVSYQQANAFVRLEVKDTGPGLSDEDLEKLFTPFERLHAAKTEIEGTGIGLVLCKRLMQAMEGQIGVESTLGRGSTFWIELPLSDPAGPDGAEMETPLEVPVVENLEGPQRTILYIEDNPANFMVVESFLERRPEITLVPAAQGEIGLELALKHVPDLVLLDLHLPDIPGEVVLERLRADPVTSSIPVVILSADATPGQISKLHAAGVDNYLTKPLNLRQFLRVLDEVLTSNNCSSGLEITPCV